jgi:xanthine dehydrogenase large subunit
VADRAVFHADNAYYLSDVEIASYRCKTNTQSHTAFRGFGGPQGVIVIEAILGDIARTLGLDALDVRLANLYGKDASEGRNVTHYQMTVEDNILHALLPQLEQTARYRQRQADIAAWNAQSPVLKRGMAITPVKFGISFTATLFNQAGALVHVYTDGSVQVNHGGTEMGQGLHTKVAQIVADELGVPLHRVLVTASDTGKVPNASATAASSGTDLNGRAAQYAARHVRDNLAAFVCGLDGCGAGAIRFAGGQVISPKTVRSFRCVVKEAYANRIQLWSDGFYRTPKIHYDKATLTGRPFYYFSYGAACTEVVIDTLTGENRVLAVDILHDVGHSINPAIDIGQIEGGFVQGMGWLTTEQLVWNDKGYLATHAPSTYKIPATGDIPAHFKVDLWPEANREDNVGGSKAVGEPPFMLAISVYEALRNAVAAGRGGVDAAAPVVLTAPATAEPGRLPRHRALPARLRAHPLPVGRHAALRRAGGAGRRPAGADGRAGHSARGAGRLRLGRPRRLRGGGAVARALCRAAQLQQLQHPEHRPGDGARHARPTSTACGTSTTFTASAVAPAWRRTGAACAACCGSCGRPPGRLTRPPSSAVPPPLTTRTSWTW